MSYRDRRGYGHIGGNGYIGAPTTSSAAAAGGGGANGMAVGGGAGGGAGAGGGGSYIAQALGMGGGDSKGPVARPRTASGGGVDTRMRPGLGGIGGGGSGGGGDGIARPRSASGGSAVGGYIGAEYDAASNRSPGHRDKRRSRRGDSSGHHHHHHHTVDSSKNFMVVIRVRPPLPRELHGDRPFQNVVRVDKSERVITISENLNVSLDDASMASAYSAHTFTFDRVYDQNCDQSKVYSTTAKAVVESSLQGYNATIFAYGQTGTGKTYTMEGFNAQAQRVNSQATRGIIPRAIEQIFRHIQSSVSPRMRFLVRASYLQIYNEVISDLLKPERTNLVIREDKKKGVFVEGLSEWVVRSPQEIYGLMERGGLMRATGSTKLNELSSRSHAVFIIIAEQSETTYLDNRGNELSPEEFHKLMKSRAHGDTGLTKLEANVRQSFKVGKLNLVDLAGSERVRLTGATGQRLEESKKINQSLSALGNVIAALTDPRGRQHIPYRDSKLTRILEDSLGGNCKTTMMAMISPALESFVESLSTLKFANRAKNIKNEARVNEDLDQKSLLRRYERELKRLRAELEERHKNVVDKRRLLELEEERRRAEADRMAAIRELENRSRAFMKEKQEKKKLEHRISVLQGQMLIGGGIKDTPAFRNAIKEQQEKIRQEYEKKLSELEKERESIEEEKAQVDRYKQLLLKQRDIMVMLTQRLNERDEQIVALQDELDAYDRHQKELEEKLDEKTAALIHLQRVTMEHNAASPVKSTDLEEALGAWGNGASRTPRRGRKLGAGSSSSSMSNTSSSAAAASAGAGAGAGAGSPAGAAVEARMLITTKQYRAFDTEAQTVFSGDTSSHGPGAGSSKGGSGEESPATVLLSAEEKLAELTAIIAAGKAERERMARELEEVQAEKVSTEFLLREKLEKIVQSEIEARLAGFRQADGATSDAVTRLRRELEAQARALTGSQEETRAARAEVQRLRQRGSGGDAAVAAERRLAAATAEHQAFRADMARRLEEKNSLVKRLQDDAHQFQADAKTARDERAARQRTSAELAAVRQQLEQLRGTEANSRSALEVHTKERRAIQTIMESKIKALVDTIAAIAGSAVSGPRAPQLLREVTALQRFVNASINALRNSEIANGSPPRKSPQRSTSAAVARSKESPPPAPSPATATGGSSSSGGDPRTSSGSSWSLYTTPKPASATSSAAAAAAGRYPSSARKYTRAPQDGRAAPATAASSVTSASSTAASGASSTTAASIRSDLNVPRPASAYLAARQKQQQQQQQQQQAVAASATPSSTATSSPGGRRSYGMPYTSASRAAVQYRHHRSGAAGGVTPNGRGAPSTSAHVDAMIQARKHELQQQRAQWAAAAASRRR